MIQAVIPWSFDRKTSAPGLICFAVSAICVSFLCFPALAVQTMVPQLPPWVAEILSGQEQVSPSATITGKHASFGAAQDELRQMLVAKVDHWLKTQPGSERLRLTPVDWDLVTRLVSPGDLWIGHVAPDSGDEPVNQPWIGVSRLELKTSLLDRAESLVNSRSILSRVESPMLALAAVVGTVCIVWFSLLLDHKTRHHFSRRFQMLAAVIWVAMGIAVFLVWRMVLI